MAVPARPQAHATPSPRLAPAGATVRCKTARDVSHLDADAMRALRLGGKLTLGGQTFSVRLADAAGQPRYVVQALARSGIDHRARTPATEASGQAQAAILATRLANRHAQLAGRVHRFASDRHVVELCRAFAISRDLNVLPFKEFLAKCKDGTKLHYHGQNYYVQVEPGKRGMADATASLVPIRRAATPMARLLQALRNLFCFSSSQPSVRTIEQLLTRALRTYHAGDSASVEPPSPAAGRARVEAALRASQVARRVAPSTVPDLRGARLAGADLTKLDLSRAILAGADLRGALLGGVSLQFADLSGANLANADLTNAHMVRASLCRANLAKARLNSAALRGADLSRANMADASLLCTDLREARLQHANLSRAAVSSALFCAAQMDGAVLTGCHGDQPIFVHAKLSNADFDFALLPQARFDDADLAGTTFHHTTLRNARFNGASLGGADFSAASVEQAQFNGVDVGNGKCLATLALQADSELSIQIRNVDEALAQLMEGGLPLRDLPQSPRGRRIISEYLFQLARGCRDDVRRCATLRDWLLEHPDYDAEQAQNILQRPYLEAQRFGNAHPLAWPAAAPLLPGLMHAAICALKADGGAAWARGHAGLVMQLVFLAGRPDAPAAATQRGASLMDAYRATLPPALAETAASVDANEGDTLFPIVGNGGDYALLVAPEYYSCRIRGEPPAQDSHPPQWMQMFRLTAVAEDDNTGAKRYTVGGIKQLDQDMAACALLRNAYVAANRPRWHETFLSLLPFGDEYRSTFRAALVDNLTFGRLVATNDQAAMLHASNRVLIGDGLDVQLIPAHREALLDTMPTGRNDAACQSHFLWCVAAVLARLSSTAFFGTHDDGPFALRRYAAALGNAAIHIENGQPPPRCISYIQRLLSNRCTDGLSIEMFHDLAATKTDSFRQLFDTVRPPNWSDLP